jgi:hypothetical protein
MRFNTGQMQELSGVRREQFRHWRKVLPPLMGRDGRADAYTFAEVLALTVIAQLVDGLGMPVAQLKGVAGDLFALFSENEDVGALPEMLYVTQHGELVATTEPNCEVFASIRVMPTFARVRERLAPELRKQLVLSLSHQE